MSASSTIPGIENLSLHVTQEIQVDAPIETTFEALLEQLGPENETPEHKMPMKLEAWPGGRATADTPYSARNAIAGSILDVLRAGI